MEYNRYNIALLCTSAGYFYIWVAFALALFDNTGLSYEPVLFGVYAAFVLLFPLSVFGSLFFVAQNRKKSNKWFLGLLSCCYSYIDFKPVCLNKAVACSSRIVFYSSRACSTGFYTIDPVPARRTERISKKNVRVATVVSIYVALIGFMYLIDTFFTRRSSLSPYHAYDVSNIRGVRASFHRYMPGASGKR
jgi:hypothetical protein